MIIDAQTNIVYFSSLLEGQHPKFWTELKTILEKHSIKYKWIYDTRDIWCRDFMPIQLNENQFLKFKYDPDYLKPKKHRHLWTDTNDILSSNEIETDFNFSNSDLILDGGNVINSHNKVILTDKIFTENYGKKAGELYRITQSQKQALTIRLQKALGVDEVIIIPRLPCDWLGHSDGIVRFISEKQVIMNDDKNSSYYSPNFKKKLDEITWILNNHGLEIYRTIPHKDYEGFFYINYLQIGKKVILPVFNNKKFDNDAITIFNEIFGQENVFPVNSIEISKEHGVLNCISWTIKT